MTREEAKELLPIIQAFAEGKTVQYMDRNHNWNDFNNLSFYGDTHYRIKPESNYRPFKTKEECWEEMQKHQPFGWIKKKDNYLNITLVSEESSYDVGFKNLTFVDGSPFGIKEE